MTQGEIGFDETGWEGDNTAKTGGAAMSATLVSTPVARTRPPFRADHVGSLLRPAALREARAAHAAGRLGDAALRAEEDRCIRAVIRKQQDIGLRAATDHAYRRAYR